MKILKKLVLFLVVIIVLFVVIPLILLSKKTQAPLADYQTSSETAFYQDLNADLEALMTDTESDYIDLTMSEQFLNRAIQKELSKDNPKFQNDLYSDELDYRYMMLFSDQVGLKGVWTSLEDDLIKITVGVDVLVGGNVVYQSALFVNLKIVLNDNDTYLFQILKIQTGKVSLPLKTGADITSFFIERLQGKSLNELVTDSLPFGQLDTDELFFSVGEQELTDYLYTIDPTFAALLKVIYQENLLVMDFSDAGFDLSMNLGIFRRLVTDLDEIPFTRLEDDQDKADLMAGIASKAALNVITNPSDPTINLTEEELNQILDYQLKDAVAFEFPLEFMLNGVEQKYLFKSTNLYVRMIGDQLSVHLKMTLEKENFIGSFIMQFNLVTTVAIDANGDMVLTILSSNIGEVDLDNTILKMMVDTFDETLMQGSTLVIPKEKLNEMFQGSGLVFDEGYVEAGELVLHFGLE
ncbi:MAG: hypothetical protein RBQ70_05160 [Acholeplasma sp.]|jgi:hypothetical protein|nr:hypothetical protein [Acholeplasma sp.]